MTDIIIKPVDHFVAFLETRTPTKPVDHCSHVAALYWARARFADALDAEAVRRGHIGASIKFADGATWCRYDARVAEADARGIELPD